MSEFYQRSNGLQFVWGYRNIPDLENFKTGYHINKYVNEGFAPWERWNAIDHDWAMGSIFIYPLEIVLGHTEDGNFYCRDKAADLYYPVLAFDFYDNWSTAGFILKENEPIAQVCIGEDSLAAFDQPYYLLEDYFQKHLIQNKGSILLRERPKIALPPLWNLDDLAKKMDEAEKKGDWGSI